MTGHDATAVQVDPESVGTKELAGYVVACVVLPVVIVLVALASEGAFTHMSLPPGANLFRGNFALSTDGTFAISNVDSYAGYNNPRISGASGLIVRAAGPGTTKLGFTNLDGGRIGVTAGQSYRFDAVLFDVIGSGSPLGLGVQWFDSHGKLIREDSTSPVPIPSKPARLARTITAPAGAATAIPFVRYTAPGANDGFGVGKIRFKKNLGA